jgi:hypothetical protein
LYANDPAYGARGAPGDLAAGYVPYANAVWGDGIVLAEAEPGSWEEVGSHDVGRWVSGTAGTSRHVITWGHGRLSIAGRQ